MKKESVLSGLMVLISLFSISCCTLNITDSNENLGLPAGIVIFTFDDGPNGHMDTTERLLDVLDKYNIKGVFCLLGINVLQYPEIVRRMFNEGHTIVNHGFSTKINYFMKDDEFRENIRLGENAINEALGFELYPKFFRPQGGIYNKRKETIIKEEGYLIVPYTVKVMDAYTKPSGRDRLTRRIVNVVVKQNGGIILLHDGLETHSWILEAVEEIIITLLDMGFILDEPYNLFELLR